MRTQADYDRELKDAQEFQDFVAIALLKKVGLPLNQFSSTMFQWGIGESLSRIEVKHDKNISYTDRLWFDYEKRSTTSSDWHKTGITGSDNRLFWVIGDYNELFIILHRTVKTLFAYMNNSETKDSFVRATKCPQRNGKEGKGAALMTNEINCAKGFLLPISWLLTRGYAERIEVSDIAEELREGFRKRGLIENGNAP